MEVEHKILLVDDDHFYRALITALFSASTYDLKTKPSFFRPDEFNLIPNFDLIILDYHLHPKNGMQISEFLWQFYKKILIIIVSADKDESLKLEAVGLPNIRGIVDKELGPHKLLKVVEDVFKSLRNSPNYRFKG